eukprot:5742250-Pleurochrysis_carterae.AAC.1
MPALRTQATDRRHVSARPTRHPGSTSRTLFTLALVLSGTTSGTTAQACSRSLQSASLAPLRVFRAPEPPSTTFALAADTLETAACLALIQGHLLSAAWALAKAHLFWVLHAGRMRLPGRLSAAPRFATYRTDANFWRSMRATACT